MILRSARDPHRLAQDVEAARMRLDAALRQAERARRMAQRYEDEAEDARELLSVLMAEAERLEGGDVGC